MNTEASEVHFDHGENKKKKLPTAIKTHGILLAVFLGWNLLSTVASTQTKYGGSSAATDLMVIGVAIWAIMAGLLLALYTQLLKGKNWARIVLGIITIPVGLILLFSEETKKYCTKDPVTTVDK